MSILKDLRSVAESLGRLVELAESWMHQQSLRVPPREPSGPPEPGSVSYYDPLLEAHREQRAMELLLNDRASSFDDAYEKAITEEREGQRG